MIAQALPHTVNNRDEVLRSEFCACFYCLARFPPSEIYLWSDSDDPEDEDPGALREDSNGFAGTTAICPRCECDAVLGSASGYALTDEFLRELNQYWYGGKTAGASDA